MRNKFYSLRTLLHGQSHDSPSQAGAFFTFSHWKSFGARALCRSLIMQRILLCCGNLFPFLTMKTTKFFQNVLVASYRRKRDETSFCHDF